MVDGTDRLVCPRCRGPLTLRRDGAACTRCGTSYRGLRGIADLRTHDDLFLANRADWDVALRLDDDYDRLDFRGLLDRYFDLAPEVPDDLRRRQVAHILTAPGRARPGGRRERGDEEGQMEQRVARDGLPPGRRCGLR